MAASLPAMPEDRHLRLIMATMPQLRRDGVLSHGSAAVMHGLPVAARALERVHLTRPRVGGGVRRHLVEVHASCLSASEVVSLHGFEVTSLERTVADLARSRPAEEAVAAGDRAVAMQLDAQVLGKVLEDQHGWPGIGRAREVAAFLDGRAESPGESVSRWRFRQARLPAPQSQYEVRSDGAVIARCDFCWEEHGTLGEFDGKIKYGRLLHPGDSVQEVVYREKLREDALRDLGWEVTRWTWSDLYEGNVVRDRILRAFARGARVAGSTHRGIA